MMAQAYTYMLLVEGKLFRIMVTHFDPSIRPITRSKLTITLIYQKLNKADTDIYLLLGGVSCVVICYELWMSKTTQDTFQ